MATETRTVQVGNAKLRTCRRGTPGSQTLLFLHGGVGSLEDFDPIIDLFAEFDCVMVDSRGHGGSTMDNTPLSYPLLACDVEAVINDYRLVEPLVIGHSDGGIAGLHIAARGKVKLCGLVTIASRGYPPPDELLDKVYRPLTADKWRERFPAGVTLYEKLNPERDFDRLFGTVKAMWINMEDDNYPFHVLHKIDLPTLILCGDRDHLVSRDQTLALAKALPKAALGIFPFGSHIFHQEHPELVAPFITEFISQVQK